MDAVAGDAIELYNRLYGELSDFKVEVSDLPNLVITVMEIVELEPMDGDQKKTVAMNLIRRAVREADLSDTQRAIADAFTGEPLSRLIDISVSLSRGEFPLNKIRKRFMCC